MYLQVLLEEGDKNFHRFLCRNMKNRKSLEVYEFTRIVFGVNCSPFLAQYVSQRHAKDHMQEFPLGAETIINSTYMDDSLDSAPDLDTGLELCRQLDRLWKKAGMKPHKWLSNKPEILEGIPIEDRASEVDLDSADLPTTKTLGIMWSAQSDEFRFQTKDVGKHFSGTKRDFLRKIATLFDPLGLVQPFIIRAKIILQEMWLEGVDWDKPLNQGLGKKANAWFSKFPNLNEIRIDECLRDPKPVKMLKCLQIPPNTPMRQLPKPVNCAMTARSLPSLWL